MMPTTAFSMMMRAHGITVEESRDPGKGQYIWKILYQDRVAGKIADIGTIEVSDEMKIKGNFEVQTFEKILKLIDKYKIEQFYRTAELNSE